MKLLLSLLLSLSVCQSYAQKAVNLDTVAPYIKFPEMPAFYILKADSSAAINTYDIPKGQYTVLMYFSPDCSHCQQLTTAITSQMDSLKDVAFYLCTPMKLGLIQEFAKQQNLDKYPNIFVGKDVNYFFPGYFQTRYVPHIVIYDENKRYLTNFMGNFKYEELAEVLRKRP